MKLLHSPASSDVSSTSSIARVKRRALGFTGLPVALLALLAAGCGASDASPDAPLQGETTSMSALVAATCEVVGTQAPPGDFEIELDPQDPEQNLILATNGESSAEDLPGPIPIAVSRLDGATGRPIETVTIAKNYKGIAYINGPEIVFDGSRLGVLYRGPDGVHGAWRPSTWVNGGAWSSFDRSYEGAPIVNLAPPKLSGTTTGRYPSGSPPFGLTSYDEFLGPHDPQTAETCLEKCYGFYGRKTTTDIKRVLGTKFVSYFYSTPHPARSGVVLFSACQTNDSATCGIWEAKISEQTDAKGGVKGTIDPLSVRQLAIDTEARYENQEELRALMHPVTGDLILFAGGSIGSRKGIDVLTCANPGEGPACAKLKRIARFPWDTPYSGHYRVVATDKLAYLHFLVRPVPLEPPGSPTVDNPPANPASVVGSYVIAVTASNLTSGVPVAAPSRIDGHSSGAELVYMKRVTSAALFYKESSGGKNTLSRCFLP